MKPLVTFDSSLGGFDENGRPKGLTQYFGIVPKKPQRWRIVLSARQAQLNVKVTQELSPQFKMPLSALVRNYVLPAIDGVIAEARKEVNDQLGWTNTEPFFEISTAFEVYRWR